MIEDFFKKLKEKRNEQGKTLAEMAAELDISLKQYQNYEYKTLPPHPTLLRINQILGEDLSRIIYQENVPHGTNGIEESTPIGTARNAEDAIRLIESKERERSSSQEQSYKEKYIRALEELVKERSHSGDLLKKLEENQKLLDDLYLHLVPDSKKDKAWILSYQNKKQKDS